MAEAVALALALHIPGEDREALGGERLGGPPVHVLMALDGPGRDDDARRGMRGPGVPPHMAGELGARARQKLHARGGDAVGKEVLHPWVADAAADKDVPGADVGAAAAQAFELRALALQPGVGCHRHHCGLVVGAREQVGVAPRRPADVVDVVAGVRLVFVVPQRSSCARRPAGYRADRRNNRDGECCPPDAHNRHVRRRGPGSCLRGE